MAKQTFNQPLFAKIALGEIRDKQIRCSRCLDTSKQSASVDVTLARVGLGKW